MGAATVTTVVYRLAPAGGTNQKGHKLGQLLTTSKAAQNDIIKIANARSVVDADLRIVATGAAEGYTLSTNEITCTSATTGDVRGKITYI